jgi:hypothetical protein
VRSFLLVLSSLITVVAVIPYLNAVAQGRDKPKIATWIVWAALAWVGAAASLANHEIPATVFTFTTGLESAAVAVLGYRYGDRKFSKLDIGCLIAASFGLLMLLVLKSPTAAVITVICTDTIGTIPTWVHSWRKPYEETWITYVAFLFSEIIVLALADLSVFTAYAYPVFYFIEDGTLAAFILFSPHRKDKTTTSDAPTDAGASSTSKTPASALPPLSPPIQLQPSSPTQTPQLRWSAVDGALSYNIYRDGAVVGTSSVPTFSDPLAPNGTHSYRITAVGEPGESAPSNDVNIQVDQTPPQVTYKLSCPPNSSGWHNGRVTVTFIGTDVQVGIASCTPPITLTGDGAGQAVTGSAMNYAGESASITVSVNIDQTPPTLGTPVWSTNPTPAGSLATLTVPVADHSSGVAAGEYVWSDDPGPGKGTAMAYKNGQLQITLGTNVKLGSYTLRLRAMDVAGNWSALIPVNLEVSAPKPTLA